MIKHGALLHFDVEFTHPVPGVGQPMQFGFVAQRATFYGDGGGVIVEDDVMELEQLWPVTQGAHVTSWVAENQSRLLASCRSLTRDGVVAKKMSEALVLWLRSVSAAYGEHLVPCGWTLGSDMAYLLSVLGEDCHMVHYDALDISSVAMGVFGRNLPDAELRDALDTPAPDGAHHALVDARHQRDVLCALLELAREQ